MYLLFHRLYQDYQVKLNRTVFMCWLMLLNVLNVNKILMKNVTMAISCTALIWYLIEMVASYPGSILICNCLKKNMKFNFIHLDIGSLIQKMNQ